MNRLLKCIAGIFIAVLLLLPVTLAAEGVSSEGNSQGILLFKSDYEKKLKEKIEVLIKKTIDPSKSIVVVSADVVSDGEKKVIHNSKGIKYIGNVKYNVTLASVLILLDSSVAQANVGTELKDSIFKVIGLPASNVKVEIKFIVIPGPEKK